MAGRCPGAGPRLQAVGLPPCGVASGVRRLFHRRRAPHTPSLRRLLVAQHAARMHAEGLISDMRRACTAACRHARKERKAHGSRAG